MNTWVGLFRGINVGGRNKMPMAQLRELLASIGLQNVQTYIQSGNAVFQSKSRCKKSVTQKICKATTDQFGFDVNLMLLSKLELLSAIQNNPFSDRNAAPKTLHYFFLWSLPKSPEMDRLKGLAGETERFELIETVFYFYAPDGFGRSKLAAGAEKQLGVAATARNNATVQKLAEMLTEGQS